MPNPIDKNYNGNKHIGGKPACGTVCKNGFDKPDQIKSVQSKITPEKNPGNDRPGNGKNQIDSFAFHR